MNSTGEKNKITATPEQLRDMYEGGMRIREIASLYDCCPAAVSLRLKKLGVKTRSPHDYPASEKAKEAWRQNGRNTKGHAVSPETKALMSASATGRRKRSDYEFGGHEKLRCDGYVKVYVPNHPNCTKDGYVMKHILVMERHIGRYLHKGEVVHHKNHIRDDNRIENLQLMTVSEHMSFHMKERYASRGVENGS